MKLVQIAYTSDLDFVKECLLEASIKDFETKYPKYDVKVRRRWLPEVYFRVNKFSWLEAVISYPVEPRDTTGRRNRILTYALPMMNEHPDKVQFPKENLRQLLVKSIFIFSTNFFDFLFNLLSQIA